ncbi:MULTISPECIES: GNAT family N-acetyltransferase [unclassified Geodermatophilus]
MASLAHGSPVGIVFRRLDLDDDRRQARRLLSHSELASYEVGCVWYGLCDLTVVGPSSLAAAVVVRPVEPGTTRLCGLAVSEAYRGRRLGRRLLCEVADRLRASGVEQIIAGAVLEPHEEALLAQVGFAPQEEPPDGGPRSLRLLL